MPVKNTLKPAIVATALTLSLGTVVKANGLSLEAQYQLGSIIGKACGTGDMRACVVVAACEAGDPRCLSAAAAYARGLVFGRMPSPDYNLTYPRFPVPQPSIPAPSYGRSERFNAAKGRMDEERRRMQCWRDCSTFGNAYQDGGLERIQQCQASC